MQLQKRTSENGWEKPVWGDEKKYLSLSRTTLIVKIRKNGVSLD